MNTLQQSLYDRLVAFEIDELGTELTFTRRLARENGWSLLHAERVIEQYKRFLLLACEAGHVVSPSEDVDQVWHMHLTYTRSYWDGLCREVLGRPLHHGPTKGGAEEQAKFIDLYNQTLASYERIFGEAPPADIWPPASKRFGEDLRQVRVNTQRNWIIPKPRWPRWRNRLPSQTPLFAVGLIGMPLAAATWNPFDWRGPQFIAFYIVLALLAAAAAVAVRLLLASPDAVPPEWSVEKGAALDPYEAACLAEGPVRAVQAAFAAMVHGKTLKIVEEEIKTLGIFSSKRATIRQGNQPPQNAPRLERTLYHAAVGPPSDLAPLIKAGLPVGQDIEADLKKRGLLESLTVSGDSILAAAIMASPLLIGVPKLIIGLSRGRPVGFLVAACIVTVIAAVIVLLARSRLTSRGKVVLQSLQEAHAKASSAAPWSLTTVPPADLAMAVGLFGFGMLAAGPLASVHAMLPRAAGGGGCSSSSGGCGGGGCGGGGCGGGGCGGCGG